MRLLRQPRSHALDPEDQIRELEMEAALFEAEAAVRRREANRLRRAAFRPENAAPRATPSESRNALAQGTSSRTMLSPRQREVAFLIARGYSNNQIAEELVIAVGTVANHVASVLDRLGVINRVQIAAWAMRQDRDAEIDSQAPDAVLAARHLSSTVPVRQIHSTIAMTSYRPHPLRGVEDA